MDRRLTALVVLGLCLAAPARAADAGADADGRTAAESPKGTDMQVDKLAAEFKVPESEVDGLRAQGLGWGEIRDALAISRKADVPVSDVMALRESGMGWGAIAQKYGFKLGDAVGRKGDAALDRRDLGHDRSALREDRRDLREDRREDRGDRIREGIGEGAHGHGRG